MKLVRQYILKECLSKINKQTGKVDLSEYEGLSELGASDVKLQPDDVAILVDSSKAVDVEESTEDRQPVRYFWYKDGIDIRIAQ